MEVSGQLHAPAALPSPPITDSIVDWVGPRATLEMNGMKFGTMSLH
jgi:hypothetical protein